MTIKNHFKDQAMTIEQIVQWAKDYVTKTGSLPTPNSETWASVDKTLRRGEESLKTLYGERRLSDLI